MSLIAFAVLAAVGIVAFLVYKKKIRTRLFKTKEKRTSVLETKDDK